MKKKEKTSFCILMSGGSPLKPHQKDYLKGSREESGILSHILLAPGTPCASAISDALSFRTIRANLGSPSSNKACTSSATSSVTLALYTTEYLCGFALADITIPAIIWEISSFHPSASGKRRAKRAPLPKVLSLIKLSSPFAEAKP